MIHFQTLKPKLVGCSTMSSNVKNKLMAPEMLWEFFKDSDFCFIYLLLLIKIFKKLIMIWSLMIMQERMLCSDKLKYRCVIFSSCSGVCFNNSGANNSVHNFVYDRFLNEYCKKQSSAF